MAKKFSVSDLHRLSPATDSAASLNAAEVPNTTCRDTIVETGFLAGAAKDEK
ncbi:MAG TPA: hypothetical protein VK191_15550 [Symbiobacteriaceae bacterium]|nr:hypothetical protein [Symbiobacteriaceae bacterium]